MRKTFIQFDVYCANYRQCSVSSGQLPLLDPVLRLLSNSASYAWRQSRNYGPPKLMLIHPGFELDIPIWNEMQILESIYLDLNRMFSSESLHTCRLCIRALPYGTMRANEKSCVHALRRIERRLIDSCRTTWNPAHSGYWRKSPPFSNATKKTEFDIRQALLKKIAAKNVSQFSVPMRENQRTDNKVETREDF